MKTKIIFLLMVFMSLGILSGRAQDITQETDSTVVIGISELRVITQMSEDLKYTKEELEMADSVISFQRELIDTQDLVLQYRTQQLQETVRKSYRQNTKTGLIAGGAGVVVGVILGLLLR